MVESLDIRGIKKSFAFSVVKYLTAENRREKSYIVNLKSI